MNPDIPRSDHEYLRLQAIHLDGRREAVMVGISYGDPVYFSLRFDVSGQSFSYEAPDAFAALRQARQWYEPQGWRVLCQGARRDAYAFGTLLQTHLGEQLHVLKPGQPASDQDTVFIFDDADADQVGTLAEQQAFFERLRAAS